MADETTQPPEAVKTEQVKPAVKDSQADRIEALKKKQAQIEAQIKALQQKDISKKRKDETRLKVLIGAAMMADVDKTTEGNVEAGAKQKKDIMVVLNRAIQRKQDRDFLTSAGWL